LTKDIGNMVCYVAWYLGRFIVGQNIVINGRGDHARLATPSIARAAPSRMGCPA
jgi:hypothetical protein